MFHYKPQFTKFDIQEKGMSLVSYFCHNGSNFPQRLFNSREEAVRIVEEYGLIK